VASKWLMRRGRPLILATASRRVVSSLSQGWTRSCELSERYRSRRFSCTHTPKTCRECWWGRLMSLATVAASLSIFCRRNTPWRSALLRILRPFVRKFSRAYVLHFTGLRRRCCRLRTGEGCIDLNYSSSYAYASHSSRELSSSLLFMTPPLHSPARLCRNGPRRKSVSLENSDHHSQDRDSEHRRWNA
jgi:hypothetical protein